MNREYVRFCVTVILCCLLSIPTWSAPDGSDLAPSEKPIRSIRLGIVLSVGGLGDHSFNDAAYSGIQKLRQIPGCLIDVVEPSDVAAIESGLEYLCGRKPDLIIGVGLFANEPMRRVAERHSEQHFLLLDSAISLPNVLSILFNEEEGSFFAGALAGLLTKSGKVGFLGGMRSPVIAVFERGFSNGLLFVNSQAKLLSRYAGETSEAFNSPEVGLRLGKEMSAAGVDIVYHAAGRTGLGLIEAARREKMLVIGVDSDQSALAPGKVVGSIVKRLDVALEKAYQQIVDGSFKGGILTLGLSDAGIQLELSRFNRGQITPLVQERLHDVESFLLHHTEKTP
ncbi:MAG: BMP family ABC transporter substrate-binding protein [Candidatus Riflebacteria bacterium]|nr:BMP family ABC transporter substrate-binding protein [Candidatus Riflebacteria bacterium]